MLIPDAPYDNYQTVRQFIADQQAAVEQYWSDVPFAAGCAAERANPCITMETDRLCVDHEGRVVTFHFMVAVWTLEPRELVQALRAAADEIERQVK